MKAIDEVLEHLTLTKHGPEDMQVTLTAHALLLAVHIKALACHCECLGMNAENSAAVCNGQDYIPYGEGTYHEVMQKWDMIDEEGEPKI